RRCDIGTCPSPGCPAPAHHAPDTPSHKRRAACRPRPAPAGCHRSRSPGSGISPPAWLPGSPCQTLADRGAPDRGARSILAWKADRLVVRGSRLLLADVAIVGHLSEDIELAGPRRTGIPV